jgi:uncharacterized protein (TIGR03067 family)
MLRALVAVSMLLALPTLVTADDVDKSLTGTWVPTTAELGGMKYPDEILKKTKMVIKDDKYSVSIGEEADRGTLKFDKTAKPKAADVISNFGPNKGKTFPTIYELKDDTLTICYDLSGKNRPAEFKTQKGTMLYLVTYKLSKP